MKKEMEKIETREPVLPEVCTQPQCMLRDRGFNSEFAANLIVRLLSGEEVWDLIPEDRLIVGLDRCRRCVRSVLRDGRPIATAEELEELVAAGQRFRRRLRRSRGRA